MTTHVALSRERLHALAARLRSDPPATTPASFAPTAVSMPTPDIVLVGCSSEKLDTRGLLLPASTVYTSRLFKLALAYARTLAPDERIRIVSAAHHTLGVDELIKNYDHRLGELPLREREAWGGRAVHGLRSEFGRGPLHVVVLAGADYVHAIKDGAVGLGWKFHVPFGNMPIGRRIQWLQRQLAASESPKRPAEEDSADVVAFVAMHAAEALTQPTPPGSYPTHLEIAHTLRDEAERIQQRQLNTHAAIAYLHDLAATTSPLWARKLDAVVRALQKGEHRGARLARHAGTEPPPTARPSMEEPPSKPLTHAVPASAGPSPSSSSGREWRCGLCGFCAAEQVVHRGLGIYDCPGTKWIHGPVQRHDAPTASDLADRPLAPEQIEALHRMERGELAPSRSRRQAADELAAMRVTLRVLRNHWHDVLEHEGMARVVDGDAGRAHQRTADAARTRATDSLAALHDGLRLVEQHLHDAKTADEARAIAAWNRASLIARKAKLRARRMAKPPEAIDAELLKQARAIAKDADAGPSQHLQIEAALVVRARTGHGDAPGRWERSAARANARRERGAPLFARTDFMQRVTAEERRQQIAGGTLVIVEQERQHDERREDQVRHYRALVAAAIPPEEFAELEARRGKLPASLEYAVDFWHGEARARALVKEDPVWDEVRAIEETLRAQAEREAALAGAQRDLFEVERPS